MLSKFGMVECSPVSTPMITGCKLNKDDEYPSVDSTLYMPIIESPLYHTASRLNIMQAVGMVERNQANPKESHVVAVM